MWAPEYHGLDASQLSGFFSQLGQDVLTEKFLVQKNFNFSFCDIGAHDGVTYSNSYLFEKKYGWLGLCVEPNPTVFAELQINRKSINENLAISNSNEDQVYLEIIGYSNMLSGLAMNYSRSHFRRLLKEVRDHKQTINKIFIKCSKLQDLIDQYSINNLGFISIDTEGSELAVLESIDLTKTPVTLIIVENSLGNGKIRKYLKSFGFRKALSIEYDEFYLKLDDIKTIRDIANKIFKKKSMIRVFARKLYFSFLHLGVEL
jgi:FkbM family methyltransferase